MTTRVRLFFALILIWLLIPSGSLSVFAQTDERCFPETGFCIAGRIREFWEQNGGLPVFGFPITPQREELIEGQSLQVQWFQRNRLELHPENARPYDVLLGRLGADLLTLQGRDPFLFPKSESQAGCRFFPETGHNVCGDILSAWRANGLEIDGNSGKTEAENLALFGLPLSDPITETLGDGKQYTVQWFERARFELHPENAPPYNVLLGLLGSEVAAASSQPKPLPPPSFNNCQPDPNPDAAPNYPVMIVSIDKETESVMLRNVSTEAVNLDGWHMCSIKGNQEHLGIGGMLAAGETKDFKHQGGYIWSNSDTDDGALYNANGQLVSYWKDNE